MNTPGLIENFDIKLKHIQVPNKIWNSTLQRWCKTSTSFIKQLLLLIQARAAIVAFDKYLHNPMDVRSCKIHVALTDKIVEARANLVGKENVFCILYKGFSLN